MSVGEREREREGERDRRGEEREEERREKRRGCRAETAHAEPIHCTGAEGHRRPFLQTERKKKSSREEGRREEKKGCTAYSAGCLCLKSVIWLHRMVPVRSKNKPYPKRVLTAAITSGRRGCGRMSVALLWRQQVETESVL